MLIAWSWYSIVQLKDGIISGFFFRKETKSVSFLSRDRLTGAFEVLLLGLPPHHGAARTRGIHVPGQSAHVEGRQAVGRHGAGRERVAQSCRDTETPIIGFLVLVFPHQNQTENQGEKTYEGCLHGGCGIWRLIGRGGRCCSGREGGWGRSLQFPREGGGDYAAPWLHMHTGTTMHTEEEGEVKTKGQDEGQRSKVGVGLGIKDALFLAVC